MKDYYKILGLSKGSSVEEIKKAYRKLAQKYHPDKPGGDEKKFKEINEAYQTLSDSQKKEQYDRFGQVFEGGTPFSGFDPSSGAGSDFGFGKGFGFEDIGDLFETIFEDLGVRAKRPIYRKGADLEFVQEITLEEAFFGSKKTLVYETYIICSDCQGQGYDKKQGLETCPICQGRGEIREIRQTFFGNFARVKTCSQCQGLGKLPKKTCLKCKGSGRIKDKRELDINIIKGVADNQLIKIRGMGEVGERKTSVGDLYVRLKILPHPIFKRKGDDLYLRKEVNLIDALLEKEIEVKTIDGQKVKIKLPANFSFRERIRISNRGMPRFYSFGYGDLYLEIDLKIPKKLSQKAKKLLQDLEEETES